MTDWTGFDTVFIVGNGESRKGFDLAKLRGFGPIYGCNALYRDFVPDYLVAIDDNMIREIQMSGYRGALIRRVNSDEVQDEKNQRFPIPKLYPSGVLAMLVAIARHGAYLDKVVFFGFDTGLDQHGAVNNLYKGTQNYQNQKSMELNARRWSGYMATVFRKYPTLNFVRVGPLSDTVPEWYRLPNVWYMDYPEFERWLRGGSK